MLDGDSTKSESFGIDSTTLESFATTLEAFGMEGDGVSDGEVICGVGDASINLDGVGWPDRG